MTLRPIAAAVSALLLPIGVHADEVPVEPAVLESVVVTGIRHSIESSVAVKQGNDSLVEVVSAEDLGKLPDVSIADSLARLPGLTAQRVDGRAEVISIRGLAPKYGVTLLNGRELVSTGDNRSVEFDQFPAELINSAIVYKTPDSAIAAQGLSGTVNLETVKPLNFRERTMNFNARAEENNNGPLVPGSSARGARISASYIDQFADGTVGLAFGFAHLDSPGQEKYSKAWWWGDSAIWWGGFRGLENADPTKAPSTLQGFEAGVTATKHVRDGAMAVLEFKPNQDYHGELDLYYSKFAQEVNGREFQSSLMPDWSGNGTPSAPVSGGPIYSNVTTTMSGNMAYATSGTVTNVDPYIVSRYDKRDDKIFAIGWRNELRLGDWTTVADLSYSTAKRDEVVAEMYASATTLTGFSNFAVPLGDGFVRYTPSLNWADPANIQLRGISGWGSLNGNAQAGSLSPIAVDDQMRGLRLSASRPLEWGIVRSFEGGVNLTRRSKDYALTQDIYTLLNGVPCTGQSNGGVPDVCAPIPNGMLQSPVNLSFAGNPAMVSFSVLDAITSGAYASGPTNIQSAPGRIWGHTETVSTAFAKIGLAIDGVVPIHGNLGMQFVHTNQNSTGIFWGNNELIPVSIGKSYNDVLPSLNLVAKLTPSTFLRLGAARVLARPNLDDMRAGFTGSIATSGQQAGRWSGEGGNPLLDPWRADAIDLALEKYFSKRTYFTIAGFHKRLKSSIYIDDNTSYDFTGFPNPTGAVPDPKYGNIGTMTQPINGQGGHVHGLELAGSLEFGMLWKPLDGFGVQSNFSHVTSNVPGPSLSGNGRADLQRPLEGLSGRIWSTILYYENHGFEARLAERFRSRFVAEVRGVWIAKSVAAIEGERLTDAQFAYNFEKGRMKGLSLLFEINNLTNERYSTSTNDDSYTAIYNVYHAVPERYQLYGRQYLLGFNYKL